MAAVYPLSRFTTITESSNERTTQRTSRKVSAVAAADVMADVNKQSSEASVDAAGFCGESFADNGELLSSLSPLLFSMKLFGLYFERQDRHRRRTDDPEWNHPATTSARTSSTCLRIYATVVLILMWLNAARFATVFNSSDHFGAKLLLKTAIFTWCCLVAVFQTAYYYASHSGQLLKVLLTLPVTGDCVRGARRAAVGLTVFVSIVLVIDLLIVAYVFFMSDEGNFILAPFVTYIYVHQQTMSVLMVS